MGSCCGKSTDGAAQPAIPLADTPISGIVNGFASSSTDKLQVFIIYYSMYGHVETLAKAMKTGVDSVEGVEGYLYRVEETLPHHILEQLGAAPTKDKSVPIISAKELTEADGFIFGFPTRFGAMAAQMKAFFDSTGSLWQGQLLAGKPAGLFVSTATQGGGQESTILTSITQLVHHGMLFVPIGYTFGDNMFKLDEVRGGSPYGAGTFAGSDGSRAPSKTELALAQHQGKYTASVVKRMHDNQQYKHNS
ncbi:hypothetical protein GOP47_0001373 [Adiantum capillus-veneris]|uniref:NAD(P)H dehydrogenase (quinone) n=1 Tax=Adiantum capillus-veneris TaxID=13818 RepID=A0A9D4V847_ADICA|nr:hypothetical protein GOP47_0001373 [Adiantum capillus-veneris]